MSSQPSRTALLFENVRHDESPETQTMAQASLLNENEKIQADKFSPVRMS